MLGIFHIFNQLRDSALLSYPLRQVVKSATRGSAVLDEIYTSLKDWYEVPVVLRTSGALTTTRWL